MSAQKPVLNLHFLSPEILVHDAALADALAEVEAVLNDTNVEGVIMDLLSKPSLLEFILSASTKIAHRVSGHVFKCFPATADAFSSSLANALLQRFWSYLFFIRHSFPPEVSQSIDAYRKSVELAPPILQAISAMLLSNVHINSSDQNGTRNKETRRRRATVTIDTEPFDKLGMDVPSTAEVAQQRAASIMLDQRRILEYYLSVICRPSLSYIFKAEYISQSTKLSETAIAPEHSKAEAVTDVSNNAPCSAYPMVQPMKAALYFDSAIGFGDWRILLSTRATQNLREARRADAKLFKIIVKKIKELSNGHFSDDNHKRLNGPNVSVPIYEAKMTSDLRLVYQVDCIPEYNSDVEHQVLRIFGIYTHAQLDRRLWDSLGAQLSGRGREYRRRCNFRKKPHHAGDNVIKPESFPVQSRTDAEAMGSVADLPRENLDELHNLLVLEKFVTFSQALLNSIIADQDVAHVFLVTPEEKAIIEYNSSCYVLGRSGTGKTTTMLFKILGIERAWAMHNNNELRKPRQLFVTQSRVLADKVGEYFSKLTESLATASYSPRELANLAKNMRVNEDLVDRDDVINWRNDLPECFSLLEERHFPLFITFDKLCQLLEADTIQSKAPGSLLTDIAAFEETECSALRQGTKPLRPSKQEFDPRRPGSHISYDVFLQAYWPHFSQSLTKGLDSLSVFNEFLGVIKGSEKVLNCAERFLDQKSYEALSPRSQATFASHRSTVYAIFQLYLKRKRERQEYDAADRTHSIRNDLLDRGIPGEKCDFLYVDEVQDNLLIDALLLRSLCRNPNGLFWAGDTAQTISVGSSFRFDDLKALLFRVEERNSLAGDVPRKPVHPRSFQLSVNYRSHGGIVNCAHSVIELITHFWPHAIDKLSQEKGIVDGLKPVFFHGWDSQTVRYEQFLFGASGSRIEFGAQQCILVRDQAARDRLRAEVGNIGLIMTLYESKGLEFNDVLLYNFFEDSTVDVPQWRVVLNALEPCQGHSIPTPRFNEIRHAGICSELKFLYVAITRARKNMWIADCSEKGEPMRTFWTSKDQVRNCTPGADVPRLAVSSTPEEWADFGKSLFQHKRYKQAMHCFERAGMHREVAVANAYSLREQARTMPSGYGRNESGPAKAAFLVAAEAFVECANAATKEKCAYFHIAGDCFSNNGDNLRAAESYLEGKEYNLAAEQYRQAGYFDDAIRTINAYGQEMSSKVIDSIKGVARLFYFKSVEVDKATDLFSSKAEALDFVEDYDLDVAKATLLQQAHRYAEAAEVHIAEGRSIEGICIFLDHLAEEKCARKAIVCALQALWKLLSFGVSPAARMDTILELWVKLASQLDPAFMSQRECDEISMFQAIISRDSRRLQQLALKFHQEDNKPSALLCLDHIFMSPLKIEGASVQQAISSLDMFYVYAKLLHDIVQLAEPCNYQPIQRLFAMGLAGEDGFSIHSGTFLYDMAVNQQAGNDEQLVSRRDLTRVLKLLLGERLRCKVIEENEICRTAKVFSPCLYALLGTCTRVECPRDHLDPAILNQTWYNCRVRLHLQQIQIFQTLRFIDIGNERGKQQRYWLDRLYEALNPYCYRIGCRANLALSLIPGADRCFLVVKDWVRHMIYTSDPYKYETTFLTTFMRSAILSFDHDANEATSYILRAQCMLHSPHPSYVGKDHNVYVMRELVTSLHGTQPRCLSAGIMFVRHIVDEKLPINISLLCDFIENLCGSLVICKRLQQMSTLHNVTLPKSWILLLMKHVKSHNAKDTEFYWIFVEPLLLLLRRIHTGSDAAHLLFESRSLSQMLGAARNVFLSRICRALCLLGLNIRNDDLRRRIYHGITALNQGDVSLSSLYRWYFEAKSWTDLAVATQQSTTGSPMDEMIQLLHAGRIGGPQFPTRGVRHVFFRDLEEIPHLLGSTTHPISLRIHNQGVDVPPQSSHIQEARVVVKGPSAFLDMHKVVSSDRKSIESTHNNRHFSSTKTTDWNMTHSEAAEDEERTNAEQLELDPSIDVEMLTQSMGSAIGHEAVIAVSDEQIKAARVIQLMYRRNVLRRGSTMSTLSVARSRLFKECWEESEKINWPRKGRRLLRYRYIFLGPVPHLLLCLERAKASACESKKQIKGCLTIAKHQELENVQIRMNEANQVLKEVLRLQKALEPRAVVHKHRDFPTLRACAQKAEILIRGLSCARELQEDLHLAVKGIVTIASQKKIMMQKPALCMDDDKIY